MEKSEDYARVYSSFSAPTHWLVVSTGEEYTGINRIRRNAVSWKARKSRECFETIYFLICYMVYLLVFKLHRKSTTTLYYSGPI